MKKTYFKPLLMQTNCYSDKEIADLNVDYSEVVNGGSIAQDLLPEFFD